jgi:cation diffusion facilitator CzcD-associated flavoprotein CzcO
MATVVLDVKIREKLTPDYRVGCKRMLISNDYYPAPIRENVIVVNAGLSALGENSIVCSNGTVRDVDVVIYATGFAVPTGELPFEVYGQNGQRLSDFWCEGAEAYKGVAVAGFLNLFNIMGPNTGTGHASVVFFIELQVAYILAALKKMRRSGFRSLEVKESVQKSFNQKLQKKVNSTVWKSGCKSWYINKSGKIRALWPEFSWEYRLSTRSFDGGNYTSNGSVV